MNNIITKSFEETQQVGFDFAKKLHGGEVLALYGDLGSGKTTFMQGLAKGLGITKNIISPTFIIMRSYQVETRDSGRQIKNVYHLDLYRIENDAQAEDLGIREFMGNSDTLVSIEWPDKIENILPEKTINIYFTYLEDNRREIRFD